MEERGEEFTNEERIEYKELLDWKDRKNQKELDELRAKVKRGEQLSDEEKRRLKELEDWEWSKKKKILE